MAEGHPPAAAMAIRASYRRSRLPFARPQTLQTLQRSAQLRRDKVPQQAQHAPLPHTKDTTKPQQWLQGTPRPQQWLLLGVQCCRLRGFKPSKRLKCFKGPCHAQLRTQTLPQQASRPTLQAKATPTGTRQGHSNGAITAFNYGHSRLPFAKSQTPKSFKCLSNFCHARPCSQRPPQPAVLLGVHACRLSPFTCTTPSFTQNFFPQTVWWFTRPVFTSLATFPLQAGQM